MPPPSTPGAQDTRASLCHNRFQSVAPCSDDENQSPPLTQRPRCPRNTRSRKRRRLQPRRVACSISTRPRCRISLQIQQEQALWGRTPASVLASGLASEAVGPDSASWAGSRRTRPDRTRPSTPPCALPPSPVCGTAPAAPEPGIVFGSGSSATRNDPDTTPPVAPAPPAHPARPIPTLRLIGQLMEPEPRW